MRVLHVIPSLSPKRGGPSEVALNLVRSLQELNIDAEIITTNDDEDGLLDVPLFRRVPYEGVPVWFFPRMAQMKDFMPSLSLTRWLAHHVREYDILDHHYLFCYVPTVAACIARWHDVPYTVRTMGQLTPWALSQSRLKKQVYSTLFERQNLNRAAAVHCTSVGEAEDVEQFGVRAPKVVLPLGVNLPEPIAHAGVKLRQRYGIETNTPIILFLSRLHYKKRPELLIDSLAALIQQGYSVHLLLAGSGDADYVTALEKQATRLGVQEQVTFAGFVSGYDKDLVLQGSDLFALPSYSENFGIAVAEAMAAQLPVIVTSGVQIAPEIESTAAGLVIEGEQKHLTAAITQLLQTPQYRQQLGENAVQLVQERYSWRAIAQQLAEAYQSIIQQHRKIQNEKKQKSDYIYPPS
jgi:glycosyltransferase involved in cell wall biosynthesis